MTMLIFDTDDPTISVAEEGGENQGDHDRDEEELQWLDAYGTDDDYAGLDCSIEVP